jgi:CheY-like chemotaxis protein
MHVKDEASAGPVSRPVRVLLADDDEWARSAVMALLEFLGCEVLEATDGAHAVEVFRAARAAGLRVDVAVLDVRMPRMHGPEALAALHALEPDLPALICTGFDESHVDPALLSNPRVGYLPKPVAIESLTLALEITGGIVLPMFVP